MKKKRLPILVIIPHGGCKVPEELSGYEAVNAFDLFIQSDTCANDVFGFGDHVAGIIDTDISRLFIDLDRPYTALPPETNGVIKKSTLYGKPVFQETYFPDEIAISNMLQRYYFPFYDAIKKIITTGSIKLILECHSMMAVGPPQSRDPGKPRPLVMLEHIIYDKNSHKKTCDASIVSGLSDQMKKIMAGEDETIADTCVIGENAAGGYILTHFGTGSIPMIRLSISRSLFLNDKYFSFEYLRVDELRIRDIKRTVWSAIEKFFNKYI